MTKLRFLFLMAFIEGGSVMACELLGAKMISPFFGSSLYVWAAVLGVTLFGLMVGYYTGGYFSEKYPRVDLVYWILIAAGIFLAIMPYTGQWIMTKNIDLDIRVGSTLSLLIFMFPPLVFMGMTSPVIIHNINKNVDETGKSAGSVYAVSTLGGIVATFLVGFYLLPEFGIKWPCFIFGFLLSFLPLIALLRGKSFKALAVLLPFFFVFKLNLAADIHSNAEVNLVYESEGVYGQVRVFDFPYYTEQKGSKVARGLVVNNTLQSILDRDSIRYNLWDWSVLMPSAASIYPKGSSMLLLGLGGGMLFHQFQRLGFNIEVVELDKRIKEAAIQHFGIPSSTPITVDDARHFINVSKKKYDVIVLDVFHNETPPVQIATKQTFEKLKSMLQPNGMVLMNFYGFIKGEKGIAARSVIKTFDAVGFQTTLLPTPEPEEGRNLFICASLQKPDWSKIKYSEPGRFPITPENINTFILDKSNIDWDHAEVLIDEKPILEKMYADVATIWRRTQINMWLKNILQTDIDLMK